MSRLMYVVAAYVRYSRVKFAELRFFPHNIVCLYVFIAHLILLVLTRDRALKARKPPFQESHTL